MNKVLTILKFFDFIFFQKNKNSAENFTAADKAFEWFCRWSVCSFILSRLFSGMTCETGQQRDVRRWEFFGIAKELNIFWVVRPIGNVTQCDTVFRVSSLRFYAVDKYWGLEWLGLFDFYYTRFWNKHLIFSIFSVFGAQICCIFLFILKKMWTYAKWFWCHAFILWCIFSSRKLNSNRNRHTIRIM